jgi:CHAD domain-containing protein
MTPVLGGFVVAAETAPAWDEVLAEVMSALRSAFTTADEHTARGPQRHTWLDTFDWRLYRAGLRLEYVAGELRLTGDGTAGNGQAAPIVQQVTGWRPARPHPAESLPGGPVRDRIIRLVSPRALLPEVTVSSSVTVTRLLNGDEKTVARLLTSRARLAGGADLPPRLSIAEVRGYPGQARRAARIVALVPGVAPAADSGFTEALGVVGRRPADYSNKVDAEITAGMPAGRAAAVVLLRLLDTIEANVDGVLRDIDTEFLHDLRVSVRRTRSALKLFGDVLGRPVPDGRLRHFRDEFKWLGDLTTPTRDLDVHLLGFDEMAEGLAAARPEDLEPFRLYLTRRRNREFRALARGLRSARFRTLIKDWRNALLAARDAPARRRAAPRTAAGLAADRTGRAFRRVVRQGAAITVDSPAESLHDLRKRCKELRYVLEFFAPLHDPAAYGKVIGDLKRLQDCLGEFQDTHVQIEEIRALAQSMLAEDAAPAATLLAMGEITAGIALRQRTARAEFEQRFAAFAGPAGQRRMSVLLASDTGGPS